MLLQDDGSDDDDSLNSETCKQFLSSSSSQFSIVIELTLIFFTIQRLFLLPSQQCQSTVKANSVKAATKCHVMHSEKESWGSLCLSVSPILTCNSAEFNCNVYYMFHFLRNLTSGVKRSVLSNSQKSEMKPCHRASAYFQHFCCTAEDIWQCCTCSFSVIKILRLITHWWNVPVLLRECSKLFCLNFVIFGSHLQRVF